MPPSRVGPSPFKQYYQTAEFSCGAACLVMALQRLRGTRPSRALEFELWREATTIGVPGIDKWGLTIPALRRGVKATVISRRGVTFRGIEETAKGYFTKEALGIAAFIQRQNERTAKAEGARWVRRDPTLDDARKALERGAVPIALVELKVLAGDGDQVPHWVVAAGPVGDDWAVHDPDPDGPGRRVLARRVVEKAMDVDHYDAARTLVVLGP